MTSSRSERMLTPRLGALQEWLWNHHAGWLGNRVSDARFWLWRLANPKAWREFR